MTPSEQRLLDQLVGELRGAGQSVRHIEASKVEDIEAFRALGRKAGRQLGWKVRTFQIAPQRGMRDAIVVVVVTESTALHQELMRLRGRKALRHAFDHHF